MLRFLKERQALVDQHTSLLAEAEAYESRAKYKRDQAELISVKVTELYDALEGKESLSVLMPDPSVLRDVNFALPSEENVTTDI